MEKINNSVCTIVLDKGYGCFEDVLQEKNTYDSVLIISDSNVYNTQGDNFVKNLKSKMHDKEDKLYLKFGNLESQMNKLNSQMNYFAQA